MCIMSCTINMLISHTFISKEDESAEDGWLEGTFPIPQNIVEKLNKSNKHRTQYQMLYLSLMLVLKPYRNIDFITEYFLFIFSFFFFSFNVHKKDERVYFES